MMLELSTFLDLAILALLAGTVFYAIRLSSQLRVLKESKGELEQLVSNLSINITRAHEAIQEMQEVASSSTTELQDAIRDGQDLSEELQIITESGNNLADRLEQGATQRPKPLHQEDVYEDLDDLDPFEMQEEPAPQKEKPRSRRSIQSVGQFFIRDRDHEDDQDAPSNHNRNFEDEFKDLTSRAERQLATALKHSGRKFDA